VAAGCYGLLMRHLPVVALLLVLVASSRARPEPPKPQIEAGYSTSNLFWPFEADANGTVFACTYLPTLVMANRSRLVAHGNCARKAANCNGLHTADPGYQQHSPTRLVRTNPNVEGLICQKHSDDGGKSWSPIRLVARGFQTGQIVWDDFRQVLVMHYSEMNKTNGHPSGTVLELKSRDLGNTWGSPRNLTELLAAGGATVLETGTSAGAALQLSPGNRHHPHRLVFAGYANQGDCNGQTFWWTDDGEHYSLSRNATSGAPLCVPGIGETGLGETPEGGITTSSRNQMFHGPGKCDCRATLHSDNGGDSFGPLTHDPTLIEPECMATMVNGGEPGALFHANPGHGTDKESKSPPNGRASGTVRRSTDGGKRWPTSVVLNGHGAYSYSCLSRVPQPGFVGLAWETVLPGSGVPASWSTNNVVFTLIPQNLSNVSQYSAVSVVAIKLDDLDSSHPTKPHVL
jgi:hypothetical protein